MQDRPLSRLPVSTRRKRPCAHAFQPDLVFYHSGRGVRDENNEPLERLFGGHLVFYHFSLSPGLHIGFVEVVKIAWILLDPGSLSGLSPRSPALRAAARLLSVLHAVVGREVPPAEKAPLDHRIPPSG